jgi:16S rRNA (cytosine967-C5)-methyltransferase
MSNRIGVVARVTAIDALSHVLVRHKRADQVLDEVFRKNPEFRPLDRAFIYQLVFGSLRWLAKMDWIMSHMMDRPFHSLDPRVANALRIGCYQIFYMDRVPDRAAVSETVEAVKNLGAAQAASFVNAILRRVARKADYFPKPDKDKRVVDYLAMHTAHPEWMIKRWLELMPQERLEYVLDAHNREPSKTLRILQKNSPYDGEELHRQLLKRYGIHSSSRPLRQALHVDSYPPFESCELFKEGRFLVQDEAAQLAASLVHAAAGQTVFDACSAPGGKAVAIWDQSPAGVSYFLCESSKKRLPLLQETLQRSRMTETDQVALECGDAVEAFAGKTFDRVVVDAPCSAMGTIGRNPEIKWLRTPADITRSCAEQKHLLDGLAPRVNPGGELIYMVCSFEPEESTRQIASFLETHPEFIAVDLSEHIHDYYRKYVDQRGNLLVYSGNQDDMDGFFASVLRKKT